MGLGSFIKIINQSWSMKPGGGGGNGNGNGNGGGQHQHHQKTQKHNRRMHSSPDIQTTTTTTTTETHNNNNININKQQQQQQQQQQQRQGTVNNVRSPQMKATKTTNHHHNPNLKQLPKRIILVRHGESEGNLDTSAYTTTPDHKIPLTPLGISQAKESGTRLHSIISETSSTPDDWRVYFYVSPYDRTRSTLRGIGQAFPRNRIIGVREECRIREQDFGNFQVKERMKVTKQTRERFGRFYFRFPEGESAADVFDRVSSFLESLWRDIDLNRLQRGVSHDLNLIIVSHGLTSRVFLMKWFKWTVEQFELLGNLGNGEFRVMQLGNGGEYSLAIHHSEEELREWGLSQEMIDDQKWRVHACRGDWNDHCPRYLDAFFDHLSDSDDNLEEKECLCPHT